MMITIIIDCSVSQAVCLLRLEKNCEPKVACASGTSLLKILVPARWGPINLLLLLLLLCHWHMSMHVNGLSEVCRAHQVRAAGDQAEAILKDDTKPAGMGGGDAPRWKDHRIRGDCICWLQPPLAGAPALQACIDAMMHLRSGQSCVE